MNSTSSIRKVVTIFGTRPETIKLVPILRELAHRSDEFTSIAINTAQHTDLLVPLLNYFDVKTDYDLGVLRPGQSLDQLLSRLLSSLDSILDEMEPDAILVQGDTASALAGALAAHHRQVPVAHIEAGLRSGNRYSPFPEEMNRRLITQLASFHMAATSQNVANLCNDGVASNQIFLTGNPVVDAMHTVLKEASVSGSVLELLNSLRGQKLVVLTTHRRESFGPIMAGNMTVLRDFITMDPKRSLVFPVHPNPNVRAQCEAIFHRSSQIQLVDPMIYPDFLHLLSNAWLIVSDSGGVQEEAPTLGKALLVLRENTERPEVLDCGAARLVGGDPDRLTLMLNEIADDDSWLKRVKEIDNPFGDGTAAVKIVDVLTKALKRNPRKN